jgi:predicted Zn-dependent peptidase
MGGDLGHDEVLDLVRPAFGSGDGAALSFEPAPALPAGERFLLGTRDSTQAHLEVGVPALPRDHPDAWVLSVLNAILGEGMSCRLFQSVREEKALAYDVGSGVIDYADAGALGISAGVDPDNLRPALEAILVELARLRDELVPEGELARAKAYLSGGLELRMEETRHLASWIGGQEALHDRVYTLDEALDAVAAVGADDVRRLAGELFRDEALRLAVVAPRRRGRGLVRRLRLPG